MLIEAEDQALPRKLVADLEVLHRNTHRAAQIARSLRSFARPAATEFAPVSLNAVVRETVLLMEKPLTTDGITLSLRLDEALPAIPGDGNALHQVLLNLLANARDAMAGRGEVRIETSRADGQHVRLVVADTGPGIAPENVSKIFDPFFHHESGGHRPRAVALLRHRPGASGHDRCRVVGRTGHHLHPDVPAARPRDGISIAGRRTARRSEACPLAAGAREAARPQARRRRLGIACARDDGTSKDQPLVWWHRRCAITPRAAPDGPMRPGAKRTP